MNDDLVAWLRECLDQDERVARAASEDGSEWHFQPALGEPDGRLDLEASFTVSGGYRPDATDFDHEWLVHIARHDPARVLREVASKRRMLEEFDATFEAASEQPDLYADDGAGPLARAVLRLMALPYADRPGYQESWRP